MRVIPVIFLIVLLAGCDSFSSLTDAEYVSKAQDHLDKGELEVAAIELKNALSENPENPQARWLLGNLYLDVGNMPSSEKELLKARELGVSDESVLPLLAKTYLAQGKYDDLQGLMSVQSSLSKEAQASLHTSQGLAFQRQGDLDKASESLASAIRISPDFPYALYGQAVVNFASGDLEEAKELLSQALEYDPEYAQAWGLTGDLERRTNNPEPAERAYSLAIKNSFNDSNYRLKRALVRIQLQRFDDAREDVDKLRKRAPRSPGVNYAQGLLNFSQDKLPEAQEHFELTLRANENYMPAVFYLGVTHYTLKNNQQAERYLSRYIVAYPGYMPARKLLAVLEMDQGNYQRVEELVLPALNNNSDDVLALNLLAYSYFAQGRADEGSKLLARVSELQPDSALAKTRLGIGLLMQGERPDAVESLETAIELDSEFQQADVLLVASYLRNKEYDRAEQAAQDFISRGPDNPVAHNLLGLIYIEMDQIPQAKVAFTKAVEVAPADPAASQNLAALALRDAKPDEARRIYQQVLEKHENHLDILLKLAVLEAMQGDEKAMRATLERAMEAHPEAAQPRVYLARNYLQSNNPEKALEVLGDLGERYPNSAEILGVTGELQMVKKDYSAAKITFNRLVQILPGSAEAHYKLALAYAGLDKKERTEAELVRTLQLDPGHFTALISLTRLQLRDGRDEEAGKNLVILKEAAANDPRVLAIEAALAAEEGDKAQALAILEQRFQASPATQSLLEMVRVKWDLGKHQEAIGDLEKWVTANPADVAARIALAKVYAAQERHADAIAQYEEILEVSENNLLALNNMAWYLRKTHPERALAYAERANNLDPESAVIMDTLSDLLLAKGELARAERLNMRALETNPDSPTFLFRKARILEAAGKQDEAVVILTKILEDQQDFPERNEAKAMLVRLRG